VGAVVAADFGTQFAAAAVVAAESGSQYTVAAAVAGHILAFGHSSAVAQEIRYIVAAMVVAHRTPQVGHPERSSVGRREVAQVEQNFLRRERSWS
jgi:hypothetical protein